MKKIALVITLIMAMAYGKAFAVEEMEVISFGFPTPHYFSVGNRYFVVTTGEAKIDKWKNVETIRLFLKPADDYKPNDNSVIFYIDEYSFIFLGNNSEETGKIESKVVVKNFLSLKTFNEAFGYLEHIALEHGSKKVFIASAHFIDRKSFTIETVNIEEKRKKMEALSAKGCPLGSGAYKNIEDERFKLNAIFSR